jgi:hypothetical protein
MPARLLARALLHLRDLLAAQVRGWVGSARRELAGAWAARPAGPRAGAMLLSLLLVGTGAAALVLQAELPGRLPDARDWRAAAALLARDARPGDAVLVAPAWLERARELVPQGVPVLAAPRLAGERLPGVRRVWLLDASAAPLAGWEVATELARRAVQADAQQLGELEVTRFDLSAPVLPLATLAERASPEARSTLRELGGLPRRCLLLQSTPGAPLRVPFPETRLGSALSGHATLLPGEGDAPVRLAFLVDGDEVGAVEVGPRDGRLAFSFDTSRSASGGHDLTVVATPAGASARPVCLEALALP